MSTLNIRQLHSRYEDAPNHIQFAVDAAFQAAVTVLHNKGIKCANDDTAEELVAAIFNYVEKSKE